MDAFRRRSTPFLHSSLVIEILELVVRFTVESWTNRVYPIYIEAIEVTAFSQNTEDTGGGREGKIFVHISHEKFHFSLLVPRCEKKILPNNRCCQLFSLDSKIPSIETLPFVISSFPFLYIYNFSIPWTPLFSNLQFHFKNIKKKKKDEERTLDEVSHRFEFTARSSASRLLVSRGAITRR